VGESRGRAGNEANAIRVFDSASAVFWVRFAKKTLFFIFCFPPAAVGRGCAQGALSPADYRVAPGPRARRQEV
jgi:hypothetical protein